MPDFPTREEIEVRAYEIYLNRGAEDGHELEDWLRAEEELLRAAASPAARASAVAAGSSSGRAATATASREAR